MQFFENTYVVNYITTGLSKLLYSCNDKKFIDNKYECVSKYYYSETFLQHNKCAQASN